MSADLLRSVAVAREDHDRTCRYGGRAVEVHLNPDDATRLNVEDGENLCGLTARHDAKVAPGRLRIYCDLELSGASPQISTGRSTATPLPARAPKPVEVPLAAQGTRR